MKDGIACDFKVGATLCVEQISSWEVVLRKKSRVAIVITKCVVLQEEVWDQIWTERAAIQRVDSVLVVNKTGLAWLCVDNALRLR